MDSGYLYLLIFLIVIPCIVLSQIITVGSGMERLIRCVKRQDKHMESVLADYNRCAQERNRLYRLVFWSIGTTEAAISMSDEYGADEDDVSDAQEQLRKMKAEIGMDPDVDSWEQDPAVMARIESKLKWKAE